MKIARENLISGLVVIALGLVFLSQAFGLEQANGTEGIHPMDYPKALTWLFIAVGCCIVLVPSHRRSDSDIPLFSARTAAGRALSLLPTIASISFLLSSAFIFYLIIISIKHFRAARAKYTRRLPDNSCEQGKERAHLTDGSLHRSKWPRQSASATQYCEVNIIRKSDEDF